MPAGQGDHAQAQVVVAHHHIQQWVRRRLQVTRLEVDAQAVLDLRHFRCQAFTCPTVQFVVQGKYRQAGHEQDQCRTHQADTQAQTQGKPRRFHSRASST
ncbi:hypothetical protein D3C76_897100 [compost metagenome]